MRLREHLLVGAFDRRPAGRPNHVLGTGGMVRHARTCNAEVDVIGTEVGLLHRLRKEAPGHSFLPLREDAICEYMKAITLPKLYRALRDDVYEVRVEPDRWWPVIVRRL